MKNMNGMIIVLGSPNDDNGNLSSIAIERCNQAIKEYCLHNDYKILLTGGYGEHFNRTNKPHAFYTKKYLISNKIPNEEILLSCSKTELPEEDLTHIKDHEVKSLYKLKSVNK